MPEPKLETTSPAKLREASWNPPGRTTDRRMKYLMDSITQHGWVQTDPIVIARDADTGEWVIADGHRRRRAAINKGVEEVTFMRNYDMTAQEYYAMRNGTSSPPTLRETGLAIMNGLREIPPSHKRSIDELLKLYNNDWEKVKNVIRKGKSAGIVMKAQRIAVYLDDDFHTKGDDEFTVRALEWLVDNNMGYTIGLALVARIKPELLYQKIMDNEPIYLGYN